MTGGITRRRVLSGAMAGAMAGVTAHAAPLSALQSLNIPRVPMRLVRRLERGMRGGAVIKVERAWQVTFKAQGSGIAINGEQVATLVDAPEALASLARIEESRSTAKMFPILLTGDGSVAAAGVYTNTDVVAEAVRLAEAEIAQRPIPAAAKAQQLQYLAQLQRTAGSLLKQMPRDLFYPASSPSRAVREVNLPNGLVGEFEVVYEARKSAVHGWLDLAERRVVTRIGDSQRQSREVWSMSEI